jgi:hypothetical protein
VTREQRMRADLYRAAFGKLGRYPAHNPVLAAFSPSDQERAARQAEMDRIRAEYAQEAADDR